MKSWWRRVRNKIYGPAVYYIARVITMTLRVEVHGKEPVYNHEGPVIMAVWHGRTLVPAYHYRNTSMWTILSQSRDGEITNHVFKRLGYNIIRGSTGRGGVQALSSCIKVLRQNVVLAFTPDGPRGPGGVVQSGIVLMAKKSGASMVPLGVSAERRWLAPSWDRYLVPMPFSRVKLYFGDPLLVPRDANDETIEALRIEFEALLHECERTAEELCGHKQAAASP